MYHSSRDWRLGAVGGGGYWKEDLQRLKDRKEGLLFIFLSVSRLSYLIGNTVGRSRHNYYINSDETDAYSIEALTLRRQNWRTVALVVLRHKNVGSIFRLWSKVILCESIKKNSSLNIPVQNYQKFMDDPTSSSATQNNGMTVEECQNMIQRSFRTPMVKFLMEQMEKSGCGIGSNFIKAKHCKQVASGGYTKGEGIMVCSNRLELQSEVTQVVIHELIHAYDECRAANLDWYDCAHQACSEIRAGHLSGDCHYKRELLRGYLKIKGHEQECVRRRATKSVSANPYCSERAAKEAVEAAWDICYNDTKPFDRAP